MVDDAKDPLCMKKKKQNRKKKRRVLFRWYSLFPFQELAHSITPFYKENIRGWVCGNEMYMDESGKSDDDVLEGVMCVCAVCVCVCICVWQKQRKNIRPSSFSLAS